MSGLLKKHRSYSAYALLASVVILSACSNSKKTENVLAQKEAERKQAIAEISTVNKALNAGATARPITNKPVVSNTTKFSSNAYGVAGSPRVTNRVKVRKGGGRYQVGKPYTIRGKKYYPREDPNYSKTGSASWYGPNFHGRLTANGEVYDQFGLSAAHPTLPLPSYAKVTNLENGSSVTVRINDRGPFSKNRIIDLSARAAQLLGYEHKGVAKVRVEYVGKARLDGLDEQFLVASYNPGGVNQNTIPSLPNGQPLQVAQAANNQRQALSAFAAPPVPEARPITSEGVPLILGANTTLRPSIGLSGYFDPNSTSTKNKANHVLKQFDGVRFGNENAYSMQTLTQIEFGPFTDLKHLSKSEKILLEKGVASVYSENDLNYISLSTPRLNLSTVYALAKSSEIPVRD